MDYHYNNKLLNSIKVKFTGQVMTFNTPNSCYKVVILKKKLR